MGRLTAAVAIAAGSVAAGMLAWNLSHSPPPSLSAVTVPSGVTTARPALASGSREEAPESRPARILIPAEGVDAPVVAAGNGPGGVMAMPPLQNHNLAAWYDHSVTPGRPGTSLIAGHVDSWAAPSVFFRIRFLRRGDTIRVVLADGQAAVFTVDGVQVAAKIAFPAAQALAATPYPSLRLVTCGGPFDKNTGEYLDNIIVYAHLSTVVRAGTRAGG